MQNGNEILKLEGLLPPCASSSGPLCLYAHAKLGFDPVGKCHVNGALRAELGFDPLYYCPCERGLRRVGWCNVLVYIYIYNFYI